MEIILWIMMTLTCVVIGIGAYIYIAHKAQFEYALSILQGDFAAFKLRLAKLELNQ